MAPENRGSRTDTDTTLSAAEDALLVTEAKAGCRAAMDQLIRKHYEAVYRKAQRTLRNREDAEDVTQEIFLKVSQNLDRWNPSRGRFQAWLYTVAGNTVIDVIRKRTRDEKKLPAYTPADADEYEAVIHSIKDPAPDPEQHALNLELLQHIECALNQITNPNYRIAWTLRHLADTSIAEIAEILDTPENTVKVWIHRCNEKLRKILTDKGIAQDYNLTPNETD